MPEILGTVAEVRERVLQAKRLGRSIGFVPTMGALHAGHAKLFDVCRRECDFSVASIFVNPLQFDRKEDLEMYPRPVERDIEICAEHGVNLIFAPGAKELYPDKQLTLVEVAELSKGLCGAFRPGHFSGVATVVAKLFNIVQADRAYFGEKDAQQLAIIRRMVLDLNFPVTIVGVPTVREPGGLALSSRNRHLTELQRNAATVLFRALRAAEEGLQSGERDAEALKKRADQVLASEPSARLEYLEIVDATRLSPVSDVRGPVLIAAAIWLGSTRLIDNITWAPAAG